MPWKLTSQGALKEMKKKKKDCFVDYLPPLSSDSQKFSLASEAANSVYFYMLKARVMGREKVLILEGL